MYKDDTTVEDVMANIMMDNGDGHVDGYKEVAKEAKDIAIEFARAADGILIDCEFNEVVTHEEAFEKFINQRYEK